MEPIFITVDELMEIFHCGRTKAYQICHQPDFPICRYGRKILINRDRLTEWLEKHEDMKERA